MKLTTFQKAVPLACARIPAKLKFANTQITETPPCVPSGFEEDMSIDFATATDIVKLALNAKARQIQLLTPNRRVDRNKPAISSEVYSMAEFVDGWQTGHIAG
jgi:hypothetical protein